MVVERSPGSRSPAPDSPQMGLGKTSSLSSSGGAAGVANHQDPWSSAGQGQGQESWTGQQQPQAPPAYSQGSRVGFTNGGQ